MEIGSAALSERGAVLSSPNLATVNRGRLVQRGGTLAGRNDEEQAFAAKLARKTVE